MRHIARAAIAINLASATLVLCNVSDGSAQFVDGNRLVPLMREYEKTNRSVPNADYTMAARYQGYVMGVADALSSEICSPPNAKAGQYVNIVAKYLQEHPEEWSFPASEIVFKALWEVFPCSTSPEKPR